MINLVVGDWSNDGHGQAHTYSFEANLSQTELCEAYEKGSDIVYKAMDDNRTFINRKDILDRVADRYESYSVPNEIAVALAKFGIKSWSYEDEQEPETRSFINYDKHDNVYTVGDEGSEDFAMLYMEIAKIGNPELTYKLITFPAITIGGYGLFSS